MIFEAAPIVWHNGKIVEREEAAPSIASHSLHLGIGVFDGLMAYWNEDHYYLHYVDAHLDRLRNGSSKMGLEFAWSNEDMKAGILAILEKIPATNYYIRPIVYRSAPKINFNDNLPVDVTILAVTIARDVDKSFTTHISPFERVSGAAIPVAWKICGIYVNSYLARRAAEAAGFNEGILLDGEGRITEGSVANIFFLQKDTVITPKITPHIFPGITRATLIEMAKSWGIEVIERDIYPAELDKFEGAFLAGTLMELKPLASIDPYQYDSANHPLFHRFWQEFREITHQ